MTILCAAARVQPGFAPCVIRGAHDATCPNPDTCDGCLARPADRGFLCWPHYERVTDAYQEWVKWRRLIDEAGGRPVTPEGGASTPDGYTNLDRAFLAIDACERHLASRGDRTVDLWVHDLDGARDALQFALASESAVATLSVEYRPATIRRERCENCEHITVTGNRIREAQGTTVVECEWCGHELGRVRTAPPRWAGSDACGGDTHADCVNRECVCDCHDLGRRSTGQGVAVLWDADQYAAGYVDRADWFAYGAKIRHVSALERKSA